MKKEFSVGTNAQSSTKADNISSASVEASPMLSECLVEEPYFDDKGNVIREFAILKIFHFVGVRRKKHFMYKWVRLVEWKGDKYWVALHLSDDSGDYFHLRTLANRCRVIKGCEVVQEPFVQRSKLHG